MYEYHCLIKAKVSCSTLQYHTKHWSNIDIVQCQPSKNNKTKRSNETDRHAPMLHINAAVMSCHIMNPYPTLVQPTSTSPPAHKFLSPAIASLPAEFTILAQSHRIGPDRSSQRMPGVYTFHAFLHHDVTLCSRPTRWPR